MFTMRRQMANETLRSNKNGWGCWMVCSEVSMKVLINQAVGMSMRRWYRNMKKRNTIVA